MRPSVTPASSEFLSLLLPGGGSLSLALNFGSFKQPRRRQQPRAQKTSPPALLGPPGLSSLLGCRYRLGAPAVECPRAGRPAPGVGSAGRGRGQQEEGHGPASPRPRGSRTLARAAAQVLSPRRRVGCGAGRRVPPLRVLPPAGTSSELREGAGWARGVGHAEREGGGGAANRSSGRRPPRCVAATVPLLPPGFPDLGEGARGRAGGTGWGVHTRGRGWRPSGEDALLHSGQLIASVCAVLNRVVVGCWEVTGTRPAREGEVPPLVTPLSRGRAGPWRSPTSSSFLWERAKRASTALSAVDFKGLQNKHRRGLPSPPTFAGRVRDRGH